MVKQNKNGQGSQRFSIRLLGKVTSISLRKNIVSLWMILTAEGNNHTKDNITGTVSEFIYDCLGDWDQDTGKGLSDYVSERMIQEILEEDDYLAYSMLNSRL